MEDEREDVEGPGQFRLKKRLYVATRAYLAEKCCHFDLLLSPTFFIQQVLYSFSLLVQRSAAWRLPDLNMALGLDSLAM